MLGKEYRDLADMLLNNARAQRLYKELPHSVQRELSHSGDEIRTISAMRHFAETVQKNDC